MKTHSFHSVQELSLAQSSGFLVHWILRPITQRNFVPFLLDVDKARRLDAGLDRIDDVDWLAHFVTKGCETWTPLCKVGVRRESAIIRVAAAGGVRLFWSSTILTYLIPGSTCSIHPPGSRLLAAG